MKGIPSIDPIDSSSIKLSLDRGLVHQPRDSESPVSQFVILFALVLDLWFRVEAGLSSASPVMLLHSQTHA